jgi:acetolactate synthase-1/3 small subunit
MSSIILDLRVRNHPGTMSHITGLFVRRGFNLDAIRCAPVGDGSESRLFLLVTNTPRLKQIECQLSRLHDVLALRFRPDLTEAFFWIEDTAAIPPVPAARIHHNSIENEGAPARQ